MASGRSAGPPSGSAGWHDLAHTLAMVVGGVGGPEAVEPLTTKARPGWVLRLRFPVAWSRRGPGRAGRRAGGSGRALWTTRVADPRGLASVSMQADEGRPGEGTHGTPVDEDAVRGSVGGRADRGGRAGGGRRARRVPVGGDPFGSPTPVRDGQQRLAEPVGVAQPVTDRVIGRPRGSPGEDREGRRSVRHTTSSSSQCRRGQRPMPSAITSNSEPDCKSCAALAKTATDLEATGPAVRERADRWSRG